MAPIAGWRDVVDEHDDALRTERCRTYLEGLRWPDGIRCPRCDSTDVTGVASRTQIDCRTCRYRFSVTSGTHLHDSAVPLWKWVVAASLLVESDDGYPAHRLSAIIGVSYKTAWSLGHRIRAAMSEGRLEAATPGEHDEERRSNAPGSYHSVSSKYLPAYLAETDWRARNRDNPDAFADVLRALLRERATGAPSA